eukprot:GHVH01006855.1.p1 GENE.GHVH01006855.1~~GHVH01006855.1.p1  ORF type:complete len:1401 (-),score=192.86 GHVH01006855.1:1727-5929(-)
MQQNRGPVNVREFIWRHRKDKSGKHRRLGHNLGFLHPELALTIYEILNSGGRSSISLLPLLSRHDGFCLSRQSKHRSHALELKFWSDVTKSIFSKNLNLCPEIAPDEKKIGPTTTTNDDRTESKRTTTTGDLLAVGESCSFHNNNNNNYVSLDANDYKALLIAIARLTKSDRSRRKSEAEGSADLLFEPPLGLYAVWTQPAQYGLSLLVILYILNKVCSDGHTDSFLDGAEESPSSPVTTVPESPLSQAVAAIFERLMILWRHPPLCSGNNQTFLREIAVAALRNSKVTSFRIQLESFLLAAAKPTNTFLCIPDSDPFRCVNRNIPQNIKEFLHDNTPVPNVVKNPSNLGSISWDMSTPFLECKEKFQKSIDKFVKNTLRLKSQSIFTLSSSGEFNPVGVVSRENVGRLGITVTPLDRSKTTTTSVSREDVIRSVDGGSSDPSIKSDSSTRGPLQTRVEELFICDRDGKASVVSAIDTITSWIFGSPPHLYGSSANGCYSFDSDVDLMIRLPSEWTARIESEAGMKAMINNWIDYCPFPSRRWKSYGEGSLAGQWQKPSFMIDGNQFLHPHVLAARILSIFIKAIFGWDVQIVERARVPVIRVRASVVPCMVAATYKYADGVDHHDHEVLHGVQEEDYFFYDPTPLPQGIGFGIPHDTTLVDDMSRCASVYRTLDDLLTFTLDMAQKLSLDESPVDAGCTCSSCQLKIFFRSDIPKSERLLTAIGFTKDSGGVVRYRPATAQSIIRPRSCFVELDLSFSREVVVMNSLLIRNYASLDHRLRDAMVVLHEWTKRRDIRDSYLGSLSGYQWMVLFLAVFERVVVAGSVDQVTVAPNLQHLATLWRKGVMPELNEKVADAILKCGMGDPEEIRRQSILAEQEDENEGFLGSFLTNELLPSQSLPRQTFESQVKRCRLVDLMTRGHIVFQDGSSIHFPLSSTTVPNNYITIEHYVHALMSDDDELDSQKRDFIRWANIKKCPEMNDYYHNCEHLASPPDEYTSQVLADSMNQMIVNERPGPYAVGTAQCAKDCPAWTSSRQLLGPGKDLPGTKPLYRLQGVKMVWRGGDADHHSVCNAAGDFQKLTDGSNPNDGSAFTSVDVVCGFFEFLTSYDLLSHVFDMRKPGPISSKLSHFESVYFESVFSNLCDDKNQPNRNLDLNNPPGSQSLTLPSEPQSIDKEEDSQNCEATHLIKGLIGLESSPTCRGESRASGDVACCDQLRQSYDETVILSVYEQLQEARQKRKGLTEQLACQKDSSLAQLFTQWRDRLMWFKRRTSLCIADPFQRHRFIGPGESSKSDLLQAEIIRAHLILNHHVLANYALTTVHPFQPKVDLSLVGEGLFESLMGLDMNDRYSSAVSRDYYSEFLSVCRIPKNSIPRLQSTRDKISLIYSPSLLGLPLPEK